MDRALERSLVRWSPALPEPLAAAARYAIEGGGKRLRPVLCAAAYRAGGGAAEGPPVHDLAASLEWIHAYSLVHDDLPAMDDAELRRGRPATHRAHGVGTATLAGAAMIPLAALQALRAGRALGLSEADARGVALELCRAAGASGMVGGQAVDLDAEGRRLSPDELDALHGMKTGALLTAALRMGALAARAPRRALAALDAYGRAVGLAFQIADDVLDATATAEALGKNPSDTQLDKSTYVSLHGLERARARARALVDDACGALETAGMGPEAAVARPLHALARYAVERRR